MSTRVARPPQRIVPEDPITALLLALSQAVCTLSSDEGCMIIQ